MSKLLTLCALWLLLAGCGPHPHPTNEELTRDDCKVTDLYVVEANPVGWRRVYDCG